MSDNSSYPNLTWNIHQAERVIITVIFGGIILVGIVGNVLVIGLIVLVKKLHSTTNLCLACLAVADLVVLVFLPIIAWHHLYDVDDSSLGQHFCIFIGSIDRGAKVCSALIFLLVGVERYTALCYPLKSLGWWTYKKVCLLLITILLFTFGVSMPYGFAATYQKHVLSHNTTAIYCYINFDLTWVKQYETVINCLFFFLPILVLILLYGKMIIALKTKVSHRDNLGTEARGTFKSRSQVVKMLVAVISVFVICLLPIHVFVFVLIYATDVNDSFDKKSIFIIVWSARIAMYINHASNPIVYFLMSDNFQKAFKNAFCRRCKRAIHPRSVEFPHHCK